MSNVIEQAEVKRRLGRWFPASAAAICFAWALLGWLTVIPNQDILADGIQAQSLLQDPRVVLAFPGQKHGGPLEYPYTVLAEWMAPGNYFVSAAIRPLLAGLTGYLIAQLFLTLLPRAPKWSFLAALAAGPTVIHGLLGPEGNPVGVWWLQPNWDMAWLCVTAGALVLSRSQGRRLLVPAAGGLLLGLGFFAHPAIILLIVPLVALVVLRTLPRPRLALAAAVGAALGALPAAVSYVVNARVNTWDPSHGAFISFDYLRDVGGAALGLTGMNDYMSGLLPYAIGLAPSQLLLSGTLQSAVMWLFVSVIAVCAAVAIVSAVRERRPLSPGGAVAVAWVVAMATMIGFIIVIDPVWIYSSGLAVLFWISLGGLPSFFPKRAVGNAVTVALLAVVALSTLTHNWAFYSDIPARFQAKVSDMDHAHSVASAIESAGATVVYGSYYDAIPIGYASGSRLRVITTTYNRFPLTTEEATVPSVVVAVNSEPTDEWGDEAWSRVTDQCRALPKSVEAGLDRYRVFSCPPGALVSP